MLLNLINLKCYFIYIETLFGNDLRNETKNISKAQMQKHQNNNFQKAFKFLDGINITYKTLHKNLKDYQSKSNFNYFFNLFVKFNILKSKINTDEEIKFKDDKLVPSEFRVESAPISQIVEYLELIIE